MISQGRRRTSMLHKRDNKKRVAFNAGTGGFLGAGGGHFIPYTPVYERAEAPTLIEDFLPTDRQTQNKIFRNIMLFDPIAGPAVDYYCDMTFGKYVHLSGLEDSSIIKFYNDAIKASGIESLFPLLLKSFLVFGNYTLHQNWNRKYGYWDGTVIHDPDYVEVKVAPFPGEAPIINLQPNNEWKEWASSQDPRIMEQRKKYDPTMIQLMQSGSPFPLPSEHTLFVPRMAFPTDYYGTSFLTRILPIKIYEKAIMDASISASRRFAGPTWIVQVPEDYEAEEIQEIIDNLFAAEEDPIGSKVAVREGVTINQLGAGGSNNFWNISSEWEFIKSVKLAALGITEDFVSGGASYNSMDKSLQIFLERLRAIRYKFTYDVIINHMIKQLAKQHKFFKKPKTEVTHGYRIARKNVPDSELLIPKVEWDRPLEPTADVEYLELLERLEEKGIPIPKRKYAQVAGYDINETFDTAEAEILDRERLYSIKRALIEQAEQLGFDPSGNYVGEDIMASSLGGGLETTSPTMNFLEEEPGFGNGPSLEGIERPEIPELPELPEGMGAALERSRFPAPKQPAILRTANLDNVAIFDEDGKAYGLHRKMVERLVDMIANAKSLHKINDILVENGLTRTQAEIVQYCAARLGKIKKPVISSNTIKYIEKDLLAKAERNGLHKDILTEMEALANIDRTRDARTVPVKVLTKDARIDDTQVLSGVL